MDTMFVNITLDPVIAIVGVLIPLGVAYVIVALHTRFERTESQRSSAGESTRN
jgi:hypothetical protein